MTNLSETMAQGWGHHQAGALDLAEQHYRQVLKADPYHVDALYLCGVVRHVQGDLDGAIALYRRVLARRAQHVDVLNNLGAALAAGRLFREAIDCYRQVLRIKPDYPGTYNNLGISLTEMGELAEAVAALEQAVRLNPHDPSFHYNLGRARQRLGRLEDAESAFRQALALRPGAPEMLNDLGTVLVRLDRVDEAIDLFRAVLKVSNSPEASNNLGAALAARGRSDDAIGHYLQAVKSKPDFTDASDNLAVALILKGRADEGEDWLRQALHYDPNAPKLWNDLGNALKEQGKLDEAQLSYRKAMELNPSDPQPHSNLLASLSYDPRITAVQLLEEHRAWGRRFGRPQRSGEFAGYDRRPERPLRIGYLSPDMCNHAAGHFIAPIVDHHDPQQFEVFCYGEIHVPDTMTEWFRGRARVWRWTHRLSDDELIRQIRADHVDLTVDLAGHTAGNRLSALAQRAAPIQVTYLGYPNTTGLDTFDYCLTDAVVDPPGEPSGMTEELVRLPGCFCCYAPPRTAPDVNPLPALPSGHVTFGSLQNLAKINPVVLDLWCGLLHALPTARLLVFRHSLRGRAQDHLLHQFHRRGIEPQRLDLRYEPEAEGGYLGMYRYVDISLDTIPWSGHTTACESLWMGVPFLTLYGNRHSGRMATSVMNCLGLEPFVARTPDEFIAAGVRLAGDLDQLAELRRNLRGRMEASPLCNGTAFTRKLEAAYRSLWKRWVQSG